MSIDYYLVCHDCKKKVFICNGHVSAERIDKDAVAKMLEIHSECRSLCVIDDDILSDMAIPIPRMGESMDSESYRARCVYYDGE